MNRSLACALALCASLLSSTASAQINVVVQPPPPQVIVVVEPPPPVIVVVEPPPPVIVVVEPPPPVIVEATPPEPPATPSRPARWMIDLDGDFLMGAGYDFPSFGASVRAGVMFDGGYTLQLAARYAGSFDDGSEVSLGIEGQRDFSPDDPLGFLLLARFGSAFLLDVPDPFDAGIRIDGQIGIGGRFSFSSDVALLVDARAVVRVRPGDALGQPEVDGGFLMNVGLRVWL